MDELADLFTSLSPGGGGASSTAAVAGSTGSVGSGSTTGAPAAQQQPAWSLQHQVPAQGQQQPGLPTVGLANGSGGGHGHARTSSGIGHARTNSGSGAFADLDLEVPKHRPMGETPPAVHYSMNHVEVALHHSRGLNLKSAGLNLKSPKPKLVSTATCPAMEANIMGTVRAQSTLSVSTLMSVGGSMHVRTASGPSGASSQLGFSAVSPAPQLNMLPGGIMPGESPRAGLR